MQPMTGNYSRDLKLLFFEKHDHCSKCGRSFIESDTTHLGFHQDKTPLYVGDCCSGYLKETVVRHPFSQRPYQVPSHDCRLWRYMDVAKLLSLLSSESLYFCRADRFEDPFEGAKGIISRKHLWDAHYLKFFKQAILSPPPGVTLVPDETKAGEEAQRLLSQLQAGGEQERLRTFISCWHESEYESEAMWRLYSSDLNYSVAIVTTYEGLYNALGKNTDIAIGRVKYIDFENSFAGVNGAFWQKRRSFEHEKEVRAVLVDWEESTEGKSLECDLNVLIQSIYVSPTAPNWYVSIIRDLLKRYNLHKDVLQSDLNASPFF